MSRSHKLFARFYDSQLNICSEASLKTTSDEAYKLSNFSGSSIQQRRDSRRVWYTNLIREWDRVLPNAKKSPEDVLVLDESHLYVDTSDTDSEVGGQESQDIQEDEQGRQQNAEQDPRLAVEREEAHAKQRTVRSEEPSVDNDSAVRMDTTPAQAPQNATVATESSLLSEAGSVIPTLVGDLDVTEARKNTVAAERSPMLPHGSTTPPAAKLAGVFEADNSPAEAKESFSTSSGISSPPPIIRLSTVQAATGSVATDTEFQTSPVAAPPSHISSFDLIGAHSDSTAAGRSPVQSRGSAIPSPAASSAHISTPGTIEANSSSTRSESSLIQAPGPSVAATTANSRVNAAHNGPVATDQSSSTPPVLSACPSTTTSNVTAANSVLTTSATEPIRTHGASPPTPTAKQGMKRVASEPSSSPYRTHIRLNSPTWTPPVAAAAANAAANFPTIPLYLFLPIDQQPQYRLKNTYAFVTFTTNPSLSRAEIRLKLDPLDTMSTLFNDVLSIYKRHTDTEFENMVVDGILVEHIFRKGSKQLLRKGNVEDFERFVEESESVWEEKWDWFEEFGGCPLEILVHVWAW